MKTTRIIKFHIAALTLLSSINPQLSTVFAQGSLTPPGAPAPTMKTLAQIEPRTPIASAPYTISASGSYYLTTNLSVSTGDAITIATNGVTLDLGGFTISSTAASATGCGILVNSGLRNLAILNGFIMGGVTNNGSGVYSGPGFRHGISGDYGVNNIRVSGISVSGCSMDGIRLYQPMINNCSAVESCSVKTVGSYGIVATTVIASAAVDCGNDAILGMQVSDSSGDSSLGFGVQALNAQNCYGWTLTGNAGLRADYAQNCAGVSYSGSVGLYVVFTAQNCYGNCLNGLYGVYCVGTAQNCYGQSYGGASGLYAYQNALNCYGTTSSGTYGLYATTAQNCQGYNSGSGTGLRAVDVAIGCSGFSASGTGLQAYIANSCRVAGGTTNITFKYNMP